MTTTHEKRRHRTLAWTSRTTREGHRPEYWIYPMWPIRVKVFKSWSWWKRHWIEVRPPDTFTTVYHLGFIRIIMGPQKWRLKVTYANDRHREGR